MSKNKCNICGYPARIAYKEVDSETGAIREKFHTVQCLGHNVFPIQWNRHPEHDKYKLHVIKQRRKTNA